MERVNLPDLPIKKYSAEINQYYDFHFCKIEEIDEVVEFIDRYWQKNHILVLSRELLDWQHLDKKNHRYNFVVARSKTSQQIKAILGFIPNYQFAEKIESIEVWGALWKSIEVNFGLGMLLYYYLTENLAMETLAVLGVNARVFDLYDSWQFSRGELETYYLLNEKLDNYHLLQLKKTNEKNEQKITVSSDLKITRITQNEFISYAGQLIFSRYKNSSYFINRFFNHPLYHYECYGIFQDPACRAIFFVRSCYHQGAVALRIVDFIGKPEALIGSYHEFQKLLQEKRAEYLDFLCSGLAEEILTEANFVKKNNDKIILPNYYEPYELRNIDVTYVFKTANQEEHPVFFKADGDQDRPSLLLV